MNQIRQNGFYIIGAHRLVSRLIFHCVSCRRLRGPSSIQRMSDLPSERVNQSALFDFVRIDFFGPLYVKYRRSLVKNYVVFSHVSILVRFMLKFVRICHLIHSLWRSDVSLLSEAQSKRSFVIRGQISMVLQTNLKVDRKSVV